MAVVCNELQHAAAAAVNIVAILLGVKMYYSFSAFE